MEAVGSCAQSSEDDPGVWTYNPNQNAVWETFEGKARLGTGTDPQWTNLRGGFTTGDYKLRDRYRGQAAQVR